MKIKNIVKGILIAAMLFNTTVNTASAEENTTETRPMILDIEEADQVTAPIMVERPKEPMKSVRIDWDVIPGAVAYNLIILKNPKDHISQAIATQYKLYNNGCEMNTDWMYYVRDYYWSICPVNSQGEQIGDWTEPKHMSEVTANPTAPKINAEYDKMAYAPMYPVYSWIPHLNAHSYEIQIYREDRSGTFKPLRSLHTNSNVYYEDAGYTWPGKYKWQVRSLDTDGNPNSDWSDFSEFTVTTPVKVVALGDSITHGGGVSSVPPSLTTYNWETYSEVPIKNLGLSGDTTQGMNDRFEREVLPFNPQILIIMGGVNNFRAGEDAWETIDALEKIRNKCYAYNIVPVFLTATPINEALMARVSSIETPAYNWKYEQQVLNGWVKQQKYWVDITPQLTNTNGRLKEEMTTDGLHPDMEAKKIIGELVSEYLLNTFPQLELQEK